jgi:hypothetical protein
VHVISVGACGNQRLLIGVNAFEKAQKVIAGLKELKHEWGFTHVEPEGLAPVGFAAMNLGVVHAKPVGVEVPFITPDECELGYAVWRNPKNRFTKSRIGLLKSRRLILGSRAIRRNSNGDFIGRSFRFLATTPRPNRRRGGRFRHSRSSRQADQIATHCDQSPQEQLPPNGKLLRVDGYTTWQAGRFALPI